MVRAAQSTDGACSVHARMHSGIILWNSSYLTVLFCPDLNRNESPLSSTISIIATASAVTTSINVPSHTTTIS